MKTKLPILAASIIGLLILIGCAHLTPGADPLVVRVEQTQSGAMGTFDLVLHEDQANRSFWATNAPAFHSFCEWLRTPQKYNGSNVARCVAIQFNVDDLKLAYKAGKTTGNSNALYTAFTVLSAAVGQASSWQNIVTSPIHP